ncbi:MAG: FecR domain-containing protein [Paracoccaceae bacterium]
MRSIAAILGILLLLTGVASNASAAERIGQVKVASGDVTIERDGQKIAVETGTELFEQDVILTGPESAVGMTFSDNSRMSLGPDSSLTLVSYSYQQGGKQDGFNARLKAGSLTAASGNIAKSRPLAMKVLMPTTVLGVKGTEFAVRVGGES